MFKNDENDVLVAQVVNAAAGTMTADDARWVLDTMREIARNMNRKEKAIWASTIQRPRPPPARPS